MASKEKPIQLEDKFGVSINPLNLKEKYPPVGSSQKIHTKTYLAIVGITLLMISSYALGIEKGKRIAKQTFADASRNLVKENQQDNVSKPQDQQHITQQQKDLKVEQPKIPVIKNETKKETTTTQPLLENNFKGYIIQVATYKKDSSYSQREISALEKRGYKIHLIPSGEYLQVCAGTFNTKEDAMSHMKELKKIYKDCYIRKI